MSEYGITFSEMIPDLEMLIGAHCPVSSGYGAAAEYLISAGGNTMQIFSGNPRGWKKAPLDSEKAARFTDIRKDLGIGPLLIHSPYLINIAGGGEVYEKSVESLSLELGRADILGADFFVLHPGSGGDAGLEAGILKVAETLNSIIDTEEPRVRILLENTAGGTASPGRDLDTLLRMRDLTGGRVGFCLDTAHAFQSGYSIDSLLRHRFAELAEAVHANDSKSEQGSGIDRHAHIGEGGIGLEGFAKIVNHPSLRNKPFIIETPKEENKDRENISVLKSLRSQKNL